MAPSPNRRKSIAVTHQLKSSRPSHKRRPHSITPGDSVLKQISPASRARRSIGPRKSILKLPPALNQDDPDEATQSMDLTRDFRGDTDNTRKSFGRRVSFAPNAHVRIFEKDNNNNTNSTQSPSSSPSAADSPAHQAPPPPPLVNDENDYPGANKNRRRSSLRRSMAFSENGEASMDIDSEFDNSSPLPAGFLLSASALQDEEFGGEDDFDDDEMEMTMALKGNIRRRSSAAGARRSSVVPPSLPYPDLVPPQPEHVLLDTSSQSMDMSNNSFADSSMQDTRPMEFTAPVGKSLNKPKPPSAEWLALRAVTHSGDTPYEPPPSDEDDDGDFDLGAVGRSSYGGSEDMDLTEAEMRIRATQIVDEVHEDSFTSSEGDSLDSSEEAMGNRTLNLTNMRRQSLARTESSSTDVTGVHDHSGEAPRDEVIHNPIVSSVEERALSPPLPPAAPLPAFQPVFTAPLSRSGDPSAPIPVFSKPGSVFSAPKPAAIPSPSRTRPPTATPASPSKGKPPLSPRKGVSAAFALPVIKPQPKKRPLPEEARPDGVEEQENVLHPAKRVAPSPPPEPVEKSAASSSTTTARRPSLGGGLRRPSGYFAQRKSLGPSGMPNLPRPASPKKKAGAMLGRASVGSVVELDTELSIMLEREAARPRSPANEEISGSQLPDISEAGPSLLPRSPGPELLTEENEWQPTSDTMDATEQWRTGVPPQSFAEEDEEPPISIEQFFAMTGIRFMDELAAPRRSTIHPSQLQSFRRRSSLSMDEIPLADYFVAMSVDVPQLELYSHVAKDLQMWIEHTKEIYRQAEEEATKVTPALFREYSAADEEIKEELLHQLKLIKANNHGTARSQWYDWRLQWVAQLYATADKGFNELTEDARVLESVISQTQSLMPSLREEHARVMKELEMEQATAAEIENSDQEYLTELKTTIAEQGSALDAFRADVGETHAKLEHLQEKLRDIDAEKAEAVAAIQESQRLIDIQKNSTQAEVFRLRDELAALEELHLWRTTKIQSDRFEFVYASRFYVSVPCVKFRPVTADIRIARTKEMPLKFRDQFPRFTDLTMQVAQQRIAAVPTGMSIRKVVQALGDFWSGCHQLRTQFTFLVIKYPLTVEPLPAPATGAIATATVLLSRVRAKIYVSFVLDAETLWDWPMSIGSIQCQVRKAYGPAVDIDKIADALRERLAQATPDDNHACFLDACIEATMEYEE
ncbi:hypothetical protein BV25DRAFT_895566 [Artomyces pyxidatus]|uniref:Uncharacterized protein n=1 Tax=Artomyces pyxidatus TaxID=48021 RepID=A0ACB8THT0_9AGAM|nr:hypothetical protein BV25DRAFT_895566 [Artomyces pyxidatus]